MARITGGLGKFVSGKLESVVFVQREGMTYLRKLPEYTKDSWTPRQKLHRERFRQVNAFCRQHQITIIIPIWNLVPGKGSGYSRFLKANMHAFGLDGTLADRAMLRFSDGVLSQPFHLMVEKVQDENNKITVSWDKDSFKSGNHDHDELMLVPAYTEGFGEPVNTGIKRKECSVTIVLPGGPSKVEAVYIFFTSNDHKQYSPDRYFEFQGNE
jgi:hypothetical protein